MALTLHHPSPLPASTAAVDASPLRSTLARRLGTLLLGVLIVPLIAVVFGFLLVFEAAHDALPTKQKLRDRPFGPR